MISDLTLLQLLSDKTLYNKYSKFVNRDAFTKEGEMLFDDIGEYFTLFPNVASLEELEKFKTWWNHTKHTELDKEIRGIINLYFLDHLNDATDYVASDILRHYETKAAFEKITEVILKNGSLDSIKAITDKYTPIMDTSSLLFPMTEESLTIDPIRESGLKWRLDVLNEALGPLILGDFGVVAGRFGIGKTAFIASEIGHMAQQLPANKKVLWFNNEGLDCQIRQMIVQSVLGIDRNTWNISRKESWNKYVEIMGIPDRIQLVGAVWQSAKTLEKLLMTMQDEVGLIVFDMLDKVSGFTKSGNESSDEKYDRAYQWALDLAIKIAPVVATSQLRDLARQDGTADPYLNKWPPPNGLKGSRGAAKQGNARFMLMLGYDTTLELLERDIVTRFISSPKNKVGHDGLRAEVKFDKRILRYYI